MVVSGNLCFRGWGFLSASFRLVGLFDESSRSVRRSYSEETNEGFRWSAELFRQSIQRELREVGPVCINFLLNSAL